jgi:hypothetical protein
MPAAGVPALTPRRQPTKCNLCGLIFYDTTNQVPTEHSHTAHTDADWQTWAAGHGGFIQYVSAAVVVAGGTGYAVNDRITLPDGIVLNVGTLTGSSVATVTITNRGSIPVGTTPPSNPVAQVSTSGIGTGATFNLTWVSNISRFSFVDTTIKPPTGHTW